MKCRQCEGQPSGNMSGKGVLILTSCTQYLDFCHAVEGYYHRDLGSAESGSWMRSTYIANLEFGPKFLQHFMIVSANLYMQSINILPNFAFITQQPPKHIQIYQFCKEVVQPHSYLFDCISCITIITKTREGLQMVCKHSIVRRNHYHVKIFYALISTTILSWAVKGASRQYVQGVQTRSICPIKRGLESTNLQR